MQPALVSPALAPPAIPKTLSSLQGGRAIAALLIVFYHASRSIFENPKYWDRVPLGGVFDFGSSGITFFFVLSGFIIYHAHERDLGRPEQVQPYLWKRFRRIYPIYWLVVILVLPIYFTVHSFGYGFETHPEVIMSSFLLIHLQSQLAVMRVAWTLFHEVLFYALFALAIWRVRVGFVALGLWFAASTQALDPALSPALVGFYLSYLHLLFGFGLAARRLLGKMVVPRPRRLILLSGAIILVLAADQDYGGLLSEMWSTLGFGVGCTLALVGVVELERQGRLTTPGWLILLGNASYSIYLVHFFTLSLLAKLAWSSGAMRLPDSLVYLAMVAIATASGVLFHLWVERPLLARLPQKLVFRPIRIA